MHRKKCCTCRYFEPNNMAGSGWCRHPDRSDISDLVMVRKNELNCRNTWDQDLWEPLTSMLQRAQVAAVHDVAVEPTVFVPPPFGTDRVDSIGVGVIGQVKPHLSPVGEHSPTFFPRVRDIDGEDGDDELSWLPRPPDAAPQVTAETLDDLPQSSRIGSTAQEPSRREGLQTFTDLPQEVAEEPAAVAATHQESAVRPLPIVETVGSSIHAGMHGARSEEYRVAQPSVLRSAARNPQAQDHQMTEQLPELPDSTWPTLTSALPALPMADGTVSLPRRPLIFEPRPAQRPSAQLAHGSKLANLPRCCGTCRDFKRNADGTSGICTNAYAFPDGAVVQSDVLACGSSMGIWWLPSDDLFVNAVDTSHHSRPTPYLDAALGQRAGSEAGRDSRAW